MFAKSTNIVQVPVQTVPPPAHTQGCRWDPGTLHAHHTPVLKWSVCDSEEDFSTFTSGGRTGFLFISVVLGG